MSVGFTLFFVFTYLLASLPVSNYLAKMYRGIDLRHYGSGNVGVGNLVLATSYRAAIPAISFDILKGLVPVVTAHLLSFDILQQVLIGLASVAGHNWPVFLRFNGGRGILTTMAVATALPAVNGCFPWGIAIFLVTMIILLIIMRSTPVGVLVSIASFPLVSWLTDKPLVMTAGFFGMFVMMIIRRLIVPVSEEGKRNSTGRLMFYRFLYDRDIKDGKAWIRRRNV